MELEERMLVNEAVDAEGFDYAFRDYSTFSEVHDDHFHKLRENYINAAEELENYLEME